MSSDNKAKNLTSCLWPNVNKWQQLVIWSLDLDLWKGERKKANHDNFAVTVFNENTFRKRDDSKVPLNRKGRGQRLKSHIILKEIQRITRYLKMNSVRSLNKLRENLNRIKFIWLSELWPRPFLKFKFHKKESMVLLW